ncbi:MAG: hypothetical protein IKS71_03265 [Bacteroidales bacterium]|nr:hypothetical protein [Bacteroidales bacterium]
MFGNLNFQLGKVNPSGIGSTIYRIRKSDIVSWPTIANDPDASPAPAVKDLSVYKGDFVLKTGKYFDKIYSTQGKGSISSEPIGETDCMMFNNNGVFSFPDLTPEALAFVKSAVNDDYVYIVPAAGRYHIIGSPDYRCKTSAPSNSGDEPGSAKGVTINVTCPDVTPLPLYEGDIVLSDGTLDAADGSFTASNG